MMIAALVFLFSFSIPAPVFTAQMMQGTGRGKTAGPAVTKVTPKRAKTVHKATPKSLLVVKKISITPASPHVGDKVAIHALVANNGPEAVKGVKIAFYLGRKQVAWQVYDIKAKSSQDYRGFFTQAQAPKAGTYTVRALVDPNRTLERTSYKCNSAVLKITLHSPVVRKRPGTALIKGKTTPQSGTRHTGNKGTPSGNPEVKTPERVPTRRIAPMPPGQIHTITVKVLTRSRTPSSRTRRGENIHALEIRWARKGTLPGRVDIFLHPYRRSGKGLCLRRNAANNGRATLPVPGKAKTGQRYIVRIQTHDGKIHGDSKSFSLSPETPVKTGGHPQTVTSARRAKGGGVAATPISIPRPLKVSTHKKLHIPHAVTYDLPPTFAVLSPRKGDKWFNKTRYKIKWSGFGSSFNIKSITLRNTLAKGKIADTVFPANKPVINGNSAEWRIPASVKKGDYFIRLEISERVNGKTTIHSKDSGVFSISPFDLSKILPSALAYAADKPSITYFDYGKTIPKGTMLEVKFYWKDGKKNLYKGSWTLETKEIDDTKWKKHSGKIANLPNASSFLGEQGLCEAKIHLAGNMGINFGSTPIPPTYFRFFLTDASGLISNVVTGVVNASWNPVQVLSFQSGIQFLTPPAYSQNDGFWRPMNPLKPGETINIQLQLDIPANIKSVPIVIELLSKTEGSPLCAAKFTTTVNTGGGSRHKMYHAIHWKIPPKLKGIFLFKATSPKLGHALSASFMIAKDLGKMNVLNVISPRANSKVQIGNQVTIQWLTNGFDPSATMDIFFYDENNRKTRLTPFPVPLTDRAWNWNIAPGSVLPGRGYLQFSTTSFAEIISHQKIPIVVVDPHHYAPSFTISSPGPGQTAHWFAGSSVKIEWKAHNFEDHVNFLLQKIIPIGDQSRGQIREIAHEVGLAWVDQVKSSAKIGKTALTLPSNLTFGLYQLIAQSLKYGKQRGDGLWELAGGRRLVEIINPGKDSLPAPGTRFEITKAVYAGGNVTLSIMVTAPRAFRFSNKGGPGGTQSISYQLSNYELFYPDHRDKVASGTISVLGNASLFPNRIFGPGITVYTLSFPLKLYEKLRSVTVKVNKNTIFGSQTGNFPDPYKTCQYFYPKLELFVTTFLADGKATVSKKHVIYIQHFPGMPHKTEKLEVKNPLWKTFTCQTQW